MGSNAKRMDNSKKKHKIDKNEKDLVEKKDGKKKPKKKNGKIKKIIKILIIIMLLMFVILAGIVVGIFTSDKYKLTEEDLLSAGGNTTIYDANGELITEVSGDANRKIVKYDELPKYLPIAFVSIEDERFYEHNGIDIKRSAAATITYIFNRGESSFGGSTITQQLIKNLKEDKDNSSWAGVQRKIREMARAYNLEKMLSKDQILEMYLNIVFMGGTNVGVGAGASYYFNKDVSQLDLAECAFLAGINHSPNSYNPYDTENAEKISERIKTRTKTVLNKMKELGKIDSEEEYNEAIAKVDAGLTFTKGTLGNASLSYHATAAINQVVKQIAEENDLTYDAARLKVYGGGYKIYTTVDPTIQARMEEEYHKDSTYVKKSKKVDGAHTQSAMVIIDHKTGYVVGTVGGLGTDTNALGTNRATQSKRQPGSSIKPIAVIAPALENGIINMGTVYDDSPTTFGNYTPKNSTGYQGLTTIPHAIEASSNIVELKIMSELTPKKSIEFLRSAGVTSLVTADENSTANDEVLSLALGGQRNGISVLEMAGAYAAIANDGEYITPTFYTRVEDANGKVVLEPNQTRQRVLSTENAFLMKNVLTEPVVGSKGTAKSCAMSNMDVGAKTGTTDESVDRWLCGFTPYYTAATWYGYDTNESVSFSGNPSAKIWSAIMKDIHKDLEEARFVQPSNVVTAKICMDSGKSATSSCSRTETIYFVSGTVPEECTGHEGATVCSESGKLVTEYCPNPTTKRFLTTPEKEQTTLWTTNSNGKYNKITETCTIHTSPSSTSQNTNTVTNTTPSDPVIVDTKKVTVPSVIGETQATAESALKAVGLKVSVKVTEVESGTDGAVIAQSINAGSKVEEGSTITITVAKIKEPPSSTNEVTNEVTTTQ